MSGNTHGDDRDDSHAGSGSHSAHASSPTTDTYQLQSVHFMRGGRITPTCIFQGPRICHGRNKAIMATMTAIVDSLAGDLPVFEAALPPRGRNKDAVAVKVDIAETFDLDDGYLITIMLSVRYAATGLTRELLEHAVRYMVTGTVRATLPLRRALHPDKDYIHDVVIGDTLQDRDQPPPYRLLQSVGAA